MKRFGKLVKFLPSHLHDLTILNRYNAVELIMKLK